jgi:hypothetical protein
LRLRREEWESKCRGLHLTSKRAVTSGFLTLRAGSVHCAAEQLRQRAPQASQTSNSRRTRDDVRTPRHAAGSVPAASFAHRDCLPCYAEVCCVLPRNRLSSDARLRLVESVEFEDGNVYMGQFRNPIPYWTKKGELSEQTIALLEGMSINWAEPTEPE